MDSFEHTGFWWDPRDPGTRWPGTLRFDPVTGAVLRRTMPSDVSRLFRMESQEFDVLHGETGGGEHVSLLHGFERSHTDVFANSVIVGFHADSGDPPVSAAAAAIEHVNEWWGQTALRHDESLKPPDVGFRYVEPDDVEVHADGEMRTSFCSAWLGSLERWRADVREEIRIELVAPEPRPLSAFRQRIHACQDLISIASLTLCGVENLRVSRPGPDGGAAREIGHFFAVPVFKDPSEDWRQGLFRCADVKDRLRDVFGGWIGAAEQLSAVRSLYMSAVYGKSFLELRLLALAQAAEAYHRRLYEGQDRYLTEAVYQDTVAAPLKAAIPNGVNSSLRQALKSRLDFGNEYSFRRRLTVLFKEHEAALRAVAPTPCQWISTIVRYRNALTHHPVVDEKPATNHVELIQCNYVLRTLLECCFLRAMRLAPEDITTLALKCYRYAQIRQRFFKDVK